MIKNIIFDVGNVLVSFRPDDVMRDLGIPEEKIADMAAATYASKWWIEFDRGVMPEEEIIAHMKEDNPQYAKEIDLFFKKGTPYLVIPFDYSPGWLKGLQNRGYKTYLLSNYSDSMFGLHAKSTFNFMDCIDGKVVSGHVKMIKPDAEIYEYLLKKFSLEPEECVFIDDRPENVETAVKLGINGIVFTSEEQANAELEKLLS